LLTDQDIAVSKVSSDASSPDTGKAMNNDALRYVTIPAFREPAPDRLKEMTDNPPVQLEIPQPASISSGTESLIPIQPVVPEALTPEAGPPRPFESPGVIPSGEGLSQRPLSPDSRGLTAEPAPIPTLKSSAIASGEMKAGPDLAGKGGRTENEKVQLMQEPETGPVLRDEVPKNASFDKRILTFESGQQRDGSSQASMADENYSPPDQAPNSLPSEAGIPSIETERQENLSPRAAILEKDETFPPISEARDGLERILSKAEGRDFISEMEGHRQQDRHAATGGDVKDQSNKAETIVGPGRSQYAHFAKTEDLGVDQQIIRTVRWSLRNKEEKIKLTLDPPDLGTIYLEIKRDRENIIAKLWTDNPEAKEILDGNKIYLSKMLKEDGFVLEKFDVLFSQDMKSSHDREKSFFHHPRQTEERARGTGPSSSGAPYEVDSIEGISIHRSNGYVNVLV
jgi:hypothetical protein